MQFGTVPIRLEDLIAKFVERLQSKAVGLPAECVFETLAADEDHCEYPPADRFVTVTPQRFVRGAAHWAGAGRHAASYDGVMRVACLCRFAADQELRSARELRDKTRSALALALKVSDALDSWEMPTAAGATTSYLREPVQPIDLDIKPKRLKAGPWAVVAMPWSVKFVMALPGGSTAPI